MIVSDKNRIVINDSKSTTVASTLAAVDSVLKAFPDKTIELMVGGKVKLGSWEPLAKAILAQKGRVQVYTFGGDGAYVGSLLKAAGVDSKPFSTLKEATQGVLLGARDNTVVLLSPGCASFDEFSDFEARGDVFRSLVCPV